MTDEKTNKTIQITASSVAAVAAAFLGSRLGVAGTAAGAGLASVVSMGGTTMVQHSLERTQVKLRARLAAGKILPDGSEEPPTVVLTPVTMERPAPKQRNRFGWKWALTGVAAVFLITMGILTLVELGTGKPISGGNEGTTLTGLFGSPTSHKAAPTTVTETVAPATTLAPITAFSEPSSVAPTIESIQPPVSEETTTASPTLTTTVAPPPTPTPVLIPSVG